MLFGEESKQSHFILSQEPMVPLRVVVGNQSVNQSIKQTNKKHQQVCNSQNCHHIVQVGRAEESSSSLESDGGLGSLLQLTPIHT